MRSIAEASLHIIPQCSGFVNRSARLSDNGVHLNTISPFVCYFTKWNLMLICVMNQIGQVVEIIIIIMMTIWSSSSITNHYHYYQSLIYHYQ